MCRDNNAFFKTFTPLLHSVMFLNATRRRLFWIKHSHYFFLTFRVDLFVCGQIIIWMDVWTDKVNEEVNERIDREIDRVIILTRSHILQTFIRNCLNSHHVNFFMCSFCYLLLSPSIWVHIHHILEISI